MTPILLFLLWMSRLPSTLSDRFEWTAGDAHMTCEFAQPGWHLAASSCVFPVSQAFTWRQAGQVCASQSLNFSSATMASDWLAARQLRADGHADSTRYWTGLKLEAGGDRLAPSVSVLNPLWASDEPRTLNETKCIAIDIDTLNEVSFGWHLVNCNQTLPVLCETFPCYDDEFRCVDNSACIPRRSVGDGVTDCGDASDEGGITTPTVSSTDCSDIHLTQPTGVFSYSNQNSSCKWTITAPVGKRVRLKIFPSLSTGDVLVVSDGGASVEGAGEGEGSVYLSDGHSLSLHFVPASGSKGAFEAEYASEDDVNCISMLSSSSGILTPFNAACEKMTWRVRHNHTVSTLIIHRFAGANATLALFEEAKGQNSRVLIGQWSRGSAPPTAIIAHGSLAVEVQGTLDFRADYHEGCSSIHLSGSLVRIRTLSSGNASPMMCQAVYDDQGNQVSVRFDDLQLDGRDEIQLSTSNFSRSVSSSSLPSSPVIPIERGEGAVSIHWQTFSTTAAINIILSRDCAPFADTPFLSLDSPDSARHPLDSLASFVCDEGRVLTGRSQLECAEGGVWSDNPPSCREKVHYCVLPVIANGYIDTVSGFGAGATLEYSCEPGYSTNRSTIRCLSTGEWEGEAECEAWQCSSLPPLSSPPLNVSSPPFPAFSTLVYPLREGDDNAPLALCAASDTWKIWNEQRILDACLTPSVAYGAYSDAWVGVNQSSSLSCLPGFTATGGGVCGEGGWIGDAHCTLSVPPSACLPGRPLLLSYGWVCECPEGWQATDAALMCTAIRSYCSSGRALCDSDAMCVDLPAGGYRCECPENTILVTSSLAETSVWPGRSCISRCSFSSLQSIYASIPDAIPDWIFPLNQTWYRRTDQPVAYCQPSLLPLDRPAFFPVNFQCNGLEWNVHTACGVSCPSIADGVVFAPTNESVFTQINEPQCERIGSVYSGPGASYCQPNGQWSGTQKCIEQRCSDLTILFSALPRLKAAFQGEIGEIGQIVSFSCDANFILQGNTEIRCGLGENGVVEWSSSSLPTCVTASCEVVPSDPILLSPRWIEQGRHADAACLGNNYHLSDTSPIECLPSPSGMGQLARAPPTCIDEQPISIECAESVELRVTQTGFPLQTPFPIPRIIDNDPYFTLSASVPVTKFLSSNSTIAWTAVDRAGMEARCETRVVVRELAPPLLSCPSSHVQTAMGDEGEAGLIIPVQSHRYSLVSQPINGTTIRVGSSLFVTVTGVDGEGNTRQCRYYHTVQASPCSAHLLSGWECSGDAPRVCTQKPCDGEWSRKVKALACIPSTGWRVLSSISQTDHLQNAEPVTQVPQCLPTRPSTVQSSLTLSIALPASFCVMDLVQTIRNDMSSLVGEACGMDWEYAGYEIQGHNFTVSFSWSASVEAIQQCADDIEKTVRMEGRIVMKGDCSTRASPQSLSHRPMCERGWKVDGWQCFRCPSGHSSLLGRCFPCPLGWVEREGECVRCESGSTRGDGQTQSIEHCAPGFHSFDGLAPCLPCARGSYSQGTGCIACTPCPFGTNTTNEAESSPSSCVFVCPPGHYSASGALPCEKCPIGTFQAFVGSTSCMRCGDGVTTRVDGARTVEECVVASSLPCIHGESVSGGCACQPGWIGHRCDVPVNICGAGLCIHGVCCFDHTRGSGCECHTGYFGDRCQYTASEWSSVEEERLREAKEGLLLRDPQWMCQVNSCSNGRCVGNRCVCNTGFFYDHENEGHIGKCVVDLRDCASMSPCFGPGTKSCDQKDAGKSKFTCKCKPGYTGRFCEVFSGSNASGEGSAYVLDTDGTLRLQEMCPTENGQLHPPPCSSIQPVCTCAKQEQCVLNASQNFYYCDCNKGIADSSTTYPIGDVCTGRHSFCSPDRAGNGTAPRCHNGGRCDDRGTCQCPPSFSGPLCSLPSSACVPSACNGGDCLPLSIGYTCQCKEGWTGEQCQDRVSLCASHPCGNGAVCRAADQPPWFACECKEGWTGVRCETPFFPPAYCVHGVPVGVGDAAVCRCDDGWRGDKCDRKISFCSFDPCRNGNCSESAVGGFHCTCHSGYGGRDCGDVIDACEHLHCVHGTCYLDESLQLPACRCDEGYYGKTCDMDITTTPTSPTTITIPTNTTNIPMLSCEFTHCLNGATCVDDAQRKALCVCPPGYTGDVCETAMTDAFNLLFSGKESSQQIVSGTFASTFLREFTLCGWFSFAPRLHLSDANRQRPPVLRLTTQHGVEMLRLTNTGVQLKSGDSRARINTTFTLFNWHHLCVVSPDYYDIRRPTWRAYLDGRETGNTTFPIVQTSADSRVLIELAPSEGALREKDGKTERFSGEVSIVQLYTSLLTAGEISSMAFSCRAWNEQLHSSLLIDWKRFTIPRRGNAGVSTLYPGICHSSDCLPGRPNCTSIDKIPPVAVNCPDSIRVVSESRLTTVTWDENDMFVDNVGVTSVTSNYRPGQAFTWGVYHVIYTGADAAGNTARCEFDVTVAAEECGQPTVDGGKSNVTAIESRFASLAATVQCDDAFYPSDGPAVMICDSMGSWSRSASASASSLPGCGRTADPQQTVEGTVRLKRAEQCGLVRRQILSALLVELSPFCVTPACTGQIRVLPDCESSSSSFRRRRRSIPDWHSEFHFQASVNRTRRDLGDAVWSSIQQAVNESTVQAGTRWECGQSFPRLVHSTLTSCTDCAAGTYFDGGDCQPCAPDSFRPSSAPPSACLPCPNGTTTGGAERAHKQTDCYLICQPGWFYSLAVRACTRCPLGEYQPSSGRLRCERCDEYLSTTTTGSTSVSDCIQVCPAGKELRAGSQQQQCRQCPQGTYKSSSHTHCVSCPSGLSTSGEGARGEEECDTVYCPQGYKVLANISYPLYIDHTRSPIEQFCEQCSMGTYQPSENQTTCLACPSSLQKFYQTCQRINECSPLVVTSCRERQTCLMSANGFYTCCDALPDKQVASSNRSWIIGVVVGSIAAVVVIAAIAVAISLGRQRLSNFICCTKPDIKLRSADFYRPTRRNRDRRAPIHNDNSSADTSDVSFRSGIRIIPADEYRTSGLSAHRPDTLNVDQLHRQSIVLPRPQLRVDTSLRAEGAGGMGADPRTRTSYLDSSERYTEWSEANDDHSWGDAVEDDDEDYFG